MTATHNEQQQWWDDQLAPGWRDLRDALEAGIDRVILYGPPGTGKTFAALNTNTTQLAQRLVCTEELTSAEVTGCWVPTGEGTWSWVEGPAVRAWRTGGRFVVDEVDRASGDVLSLLLAMTDTEGSASWTHPFTGEQVTPLAGFSVIMTSNIDDVDELPSALRDRFPVAIRIEQPHPDAVMILSPDLRQAAQSAMVADAARRVSLRTFMAFDRLRDHLGSSRAAELLFGVDDAQSFLDALTIGTLVR